MDSAILNPAEYDVGASKTSGAAMGKIDDAAIKGVAVDVVAVLGVKTLKVSQILQLGRGAVVELEHELNDPIELMVEGKTVAFGEVVVVEDMLAVQIVNVVRRGAAI